ncbi:MAG: hypothetical protein WD709_06200 [Gammaproteobacteria bacterium]
MKKKYHSVTAPETGLSPASAAGIQAVILPFLLLLAIYPVNSPAEWVVNPNVQNEAVGETIVAHNVNDDGYTLEVYKDTEATIRVRFSLYDGLTGLDPDTCPTYQIDRGAPVNRSSNGERCRNSHNWAEYTFGRIQNNRITSSALLAIMNGNDVLFRFQLENGDYRETRISLAGSKRSLTSVVGEEIVVRAQ